MLRAQAVSSFPVRPYLFGFCVVMKTYEIVASSSTFPPPVHAILSKRSRCIFMANPFKVHSLDCVGSEVLDINISGHVDCLRLSADERNIAVASNDVIKLIDLNGGREIRNLSGHSLAVQALTPRWSCVYSWVSGSLDSSWIVWDSRSHPANLLHGRTTGPVRCVEMSPDDIILAVGTDSTLQLYDIRTRCMIKQFPSSTYGAAFHPTHRMVATYGAERVARFWCLDELLPVAMSDAFPTAIQCAKFVTVSDMDPVLVASTDQIMKTLTSEPCETLATNNIGEFCKVLSLNVSAGDVGVIYTDSTSALSYSVFSMKEVLHGSTESFELFDAGESILDEIIAKTSHENLSPEEHVSLVTDSAEVPIRNSFSDGRIDHAQAEVDPAHISVRSSSTDGTPFNAERRKAERRTDENRSLTIAPRSPSMSSVQGHNHQVRKTRKSCSSRIISRSASPSNGAAMKDVSVPVLRSNEGIRRRPEVNGKPPRESIRSIQTSESHSNSSSSGERNAVQQRKISASGLSVSDFVAKVEKEHHMTVMKAERIALGVQQLIASFKRGGMSTMLKDGLFADELVVTAMLKILNENKRCDIKICHLYLPKIKEFLQDPTLPESCRQVALSSLQCIVTGGLLDTLKSCSRTPLCNIGVDVAAEERKQKAENCIKELRDLRDRREQFYRKLSQDDMYRLDAIISFIKNL